MNRAANARADARSASRAIDRKVRDHVIPTNLSAFAKFGLDVEVIDDTKVRVADRYLFYPATGFWRSNEGSLRGYNARTLIADALIGEELRGHITLLPEIEESPAASALLMIAPPLATEVDPDNQDEAAAGVPTASKLPEVAL